MPDNPVAAVPTGRSSGAGPGAGPGRRLRRRTVLRAGLAAVTSTAVLGLAGCRVRVGSPQTDRPTPTAREPSTDDQALLRALQQADALAASYARGALVRPDLADPLRQLAADHAAHVRTLQALTSGAPTSGTGPALTALTALTATSVLSQSERAAAAQAQDDLAAVGAQPARLLASVAACRSAHVALLARLPASPPTPTKKPS